MQTWVPADIGISNRHRLTVKESIVAVLMAQAQTEAGRNTISNSGEINADRLAGEGPAAYSVSYSSLPSYTIDLPRGLVTPHSRRCKPLPVLQPQLPTTSVLAFKP